MVKHLIFGCINKALFPPTDSSDSLTQPSHSQQSIILLVKNLIYLRKFILYAL